MIRLFLFLLASSLLQLSFAQFDFNQFLASAGSDPEVVILGEKVGFMNRENFNLPIVRGVEARLRSSNMDETIEDYRFRLEFLNPFERSANKAFNLSYQKRLEIEQEIKFSDALLDRYELLLSHYSVTLQIRELNDRVEVINSMLQLARQELDAQEVLKLNLEKTKVELNRTKKEGELGGINDQIRLLTQEAELPDWTGLELISPTNMTLVLERLDSTAIPLLNWFDQRTELEKKEYQLDKANSRRAIGFIQSEYDLDRGDIPSEHWGFQIGIAIPIVNADRPNLQYKKLDIMERESDARGAYDAYQKELNALQNRFIGSKANYKTVLRQEEKLNISSLDEIADPNLRLELLDFKSDINKLKSEYYNEMLGMYLQLLHLKGAFKSVNQVNFLLDSVLEN